MAVLDKEGDAIEQWRGKPIELAEKLGIVVAKKPFHTMKALGLYDGPIEPGQRELIEDVCLGKTRNAAVLACRGGGKSLTVAFIEMYMFLFEGFDCINLGGTKKQAESVYNHIKNFLANPELKLESFCEDIHSEKITGLNGSWIRLLAASEKAIRSPHAGGRKIDGRMAGGMLVIDEESKADPNMVVDALPMINTGNPQVTIRLSTFDEATGTFADLIKNHIEYGFKLYKWDAMDICTPCDCKTEGTECGSREPCFRNDHFEEVINENTGLPERKLQHRAYCLWPEETVFVRNNGIVRMTTMANLFDMFDGDGDLKKVPDGWEIYDGYPDGRRRKQLRMGDDAFRWTNLLWVSRTPIKDELIFVSTTSGAGICTTTDHSFYTSAGDIPAEGLRIDDRTPGSEKRGHFVGTKTPWIYGGYSLDESKAYLVGQYLAEGSAHINKSRSKVVTLSGIKDPETILRHAKASGMTHWHSPHSVRGTNVCFGAEFYDLLDALGVVGNLAHSKVLPVNSFEWDRKSAMAMISGLIDGDGTVTKKHKVQHRGSTASTISVRVASKALVSQTRMLMNKWGLYPRENYVGFYNNNRFAQNYPLWSLCFSLGEEHVRDLVLCDKIGKLVSSGDFGYRKRPFRSFTKTETSSFVNGKSKVVFGKKQYLYDVTTGSGYFNASGVRVHNCSLGKAKFARGFMPFENIESQWIMTGRQHAKFEINYMGWRPSTTGYVVRDMIKFNDSIVDLRPADLYGRGPTWICVDWGSSHGGLTVWQRQQDKETGKDLHVLLEAVELEGLGLTDTMGLIKRMWDTYRRTHAGVAADVGYGGYTNEELYQRFRLKVTPVNFGTQKEDAAAVFNIFNENESLVIPKEHQAFVEQVNGWRRNKSGAINKGSDHLCDSALCYFSTFVEEIGKSNIHIPPVAFSPGQVWQDGELSKPRTERIRNSTGSSATIAGFGRRRSRGQRDSEFARFTGVTQQQADRWKFGPPGRKL